MSNAPQAEPTKKPEVLIGKGFFDSLYVSWGLLIAVVTVAAVGLWTLSGRYHTTQEIINRTAVEVENLGEDIQEYYRSTDTRLDELSERVTVLETKMNTN